MVSNSADKAKGNLLSLNAFELRKQADNRLNLLPAESSMSSKSFYYAEERLLGRLFNLTLQKTRDQPRKAKLFQEM